MSHESGPSRWTVLIGHNEKYVITIRQSRRENLGKPTDGVNIIVINIPHAALVNSATNEADGQTERETEKSG